MDARLAGADARAEGPLTVGGLVDAYLLDSDAEGRHCAGAAAERRRKLVAFAAFRGYGRLPAESLKQFHLRDFINANKRWKAAGTRRLVAAYVQAAFAWGAATERTARNPFAAMRYPKGARRPCLDDAVRERMEAAANKAFEVALRFIRLTVVRIGEFCGCEWDDLDLDKKLWRVDKHKTVKKTGRPKVVVLVDEAAAMLELLLMQRMARMEAGTSREAALARLAGQKVFLNCRGQPWKTPALGKYFRRLKERTGETTPASLHGMRHTGITQAIAAGVPLMDVALMAGHASTAVTEQVYCHVSDRFLAGQRAAAEAAKPAQKTG